eukprot:88815_1
MIDAGGDGQDSKTQQSLAEAIYNMHHVKKIVNHLSLSDANGSATRLVNNIAANAAPLRVLITGGSNGIGKAIAIKFASNNHHVVSIDIDKSANDALEREYPNIKCIHQDITEYEAPIKCVEYMTKQFGGVDVLVNNAGIQLGGGAPPHEFDEALWDRVLDVNLKSYFRFSKYVVKQILKQPKGDMHQTRYHIINICSGEAIQSEKGVTAYCASKGGILSMTKNLAIEYAPLIRVNSVSPGTIVTPLLRKGYKDQGWKSINDIASKYPVRRLGQPEEVANLVYFLCTGQCGFITGENINIEGGILAQGGWAAETENPYVDDEYLKRNDE